MIPPKPSLPFSFLKIKYNRDDQIIHKSVKPGKPRTILFSR